MTPTDIAKVCHEANRALCEHLNDNMNQVPWDEASSAIQESVINGVEFNLANPDAPASASHDNWLEKKEGEGWSYGAEKHEGLKKHPCFMPYAELPVEQQAKDHLFKAIVGALGSLCGA